MNKFSPNFSYDLNWFLSPVFDQLQLDEHNTLRFARLLLQSGRSASGLTDAHKTRVSHQALRTTDLERETNIIEEINSLSLTLQSINDVMFFGIHGSAVDGSFIRGWSDLDCVAIIKDTAVENISALITLKDSFNAINYFLKKVDPYCHHGVFCILESDLQNYSDASPPIYAYQKLVRLKGSIRPIRIIHSQNPGKRLSRLREMIVGFKKSGVLKHHSYYGKYLNIDFRTTRTGFYQLKYLINVCSNAPCLWLNDNGYPTDKSLSFKIARDCIGDHKLLVCLDEIRALDWSKSSAKSIENEIPEMLLRILPENFLDVFEQYVTKLMSTKYE